MWDFRSREGRGCRAKFLSKPFTVVGKYFEVPHDCLGFTPLQEGIGLGLLTITRQPCHNEYYLQILKTA